MSWGFEIGRVYNRRNDIHARFGGQQQGGIITPKDHPLVIIITGEEGLQHGYADRLRSDGVFEYFGEGQVGDMQLTGGNKAVAEHSASGTDRLQMEGASSASAEFGEPLRKSAAIFSSGVISSPSGTSRRIWSSRVR